MRHIRSLSGCAAVAFLAASAWAGVIKDPAAGVEADNFSSAISTFHQFNPTDNGGVVGLYNDTGQLIIELILHTAIAHNLTDADISQSFTCNSGPANPFFRQCGFAYDSSNGSLTIRFFGVNWPDGDEDGSETEIGEQEGIPPVPLSCLPPLGDPDSQGCHQVGHFAFVFNNNFQIGGEVVNGWVPSTKSSANPGTNLFDGQPLFDPPQFTTSSVNPLGGELPEPSTLLLFLAGAIVFGLAGLSRRRVRG